MSFRDNTSGTWNHSWRYGANGDTIFQNNQTYYQPTRTIPNSNDTPMTINENPTNQSQIQTSNNSNPNQQPHSARNEDPEYFGDYLGPKQAGIFRITMQNLNNLHLSCMHTKNVQFKCHLIESQSDVFMASKVGRFWPKVPGYDKWEEQMAHLEHRTTLAWNNTEPSITEVYQSGGTTVMVLGDIVSFVLLSKEEMNLALVNGHGYFCKVNNTLPYD